MNARRSLAVWMTAATVLVAAPAASAGAPSHPHAVAAKSCSAGYTHAVISGEQKCLRRGEFCAHSADRQYRRYGFRCTKYYSNVRRYRLT
jgi:hypothetical protein